MNARHLKERADCGFAKTHHKEAYLSQTMNLDAIGPYNIVHLQLDIEYRNIASIAAAL